MSLSKASVVDLIDALRTGGPISILAGAACSRLLPTDIPDARTWRRVLTGSIAQAAGRAISADAVGRLADAEGVPLEAILGTVEDQMAGLGTDLVCIIDQAPAPYNRIHELSAEQLCRNEQLTILTTNFDRCFERAVEAMGGKPRPWIIGQPPDPRANILKLHGCVTVSPSLRHTFRAVGRGFSPQDLAVIQERSGRKLVVLGYAGADPDVLEALSTGQPVWWLCRPGTVDDARHGAPRLARTRRVHVVEGDFADVLSAAGYAPAAMGTGAWLDSPTSEVIGTRATTFDALVVLCELVFRARTADHCWKANDSKCLAALRRCREAVQRCETFVAVGKRARFRGGLLRGPIVAALSFSQASALSADPARAIYESHAADALEMIGFGLCRPLRARMWRRYRGAMRRVPAGHLRAQIAFLAGRSALHARRPHVAVRLLSQALEERSGDMFLGGIAYRWRALARAIVGEGAWREDIDHAATLLRFEDRPQEQADLQRTEAACLVIEGSDLRRARWLLRTSRDSYIARRELRGRIRSGLVLLLSHLGFMGRALLRRVLP